ncbi:unnamed protein product [Oppiella nova]|uniref:Uracil-DNA glycosylase-like domain-containing protein n=1 Tax=Oppiella nova TaxID=334625 RepID=A0A7R9Q8T5_9ACAR|nr:unnamed protein product [Oppiella nova]CAG2158778.1 unnamed protein product [Oppiella nova]
MCDTSVQTETKCGDKCVDKRKKERKNNFENRFNGLSECELKKKTLPDHLAYDLDVLIVGINPGYWAAYKGHHYSGPGNHFWKCLYLSHLVPKPMTAFDDFRLMDSTIVSQKMRFKEDLKF